VEKNETVDRIVHLYVTLVLVLNIALIIYTMSAITIRMALAGLDIIDSLPIALYIVPLLVILPMLLLAFYRERTGLFNFVMIVVTSLFFGLPSPLVHGFVLIIICNVIGAALILIIGNFKFKGDLKKVGKKGIAWFIILNLVGTMFPVSVYLMGQSPIASVNSESAATIFLDVPLVEFEEAVLPIQPESQLISDIATNDFGLSLRILENHNDSWFLMMDWLEQLNTTSIPYDLTFVFDRDSIAQVNPDSLGDTSLFQELFQSHSESLTEITNYLISENIVNRPTCVFFDMTLSQTEWSLLMSRTRSVDLVGFSQLIRSSMDLINSTFINEETDSLVTQGMSENLDIGTIIESFILDDLQDHDTVTMKSSGVTIETLGLWNAIKVDTSRSRFSNEMQGDVGEYFVHSYSRSISDMGQTWMMRIGSIGAHVEEGFYYSTLSLLASDLTISAGNGVENLTVSSLQSLLSTFGATGISDFREAIDSQTTAEVTYTFRIYAFRAVFIAIDMFDLIMF